MEEIIAVARGRWGKREGPRSFGAFRRGGVILAVVLAEHEEAEQGGEEKERGDRGEDHGCR